MLQCDQQFAAVFRAQDAKAPGIEGAVGSWTLLFPHTPPLRVAPGNAEIRHEQECSKGFAMAALTPAVGTARSKFALALECCPDWVLQNAMKMSVALPLAAVHERKSCC